MLISELHIYTISMARTMEARKILTLKLYGFESGGLFLQQLLRLCFCLNVSQLLLPFSVLLWLLLLRLLFGMFLPMSLCLIWMLTARGSSCEEIFWGHIHPLGPSLPMLPGVIAFASIDPSNFMKERSGMVLDKQ